MRCAPTRVLLRSCSLLCTGKRTLTSNNSIHSEVFDPAQDVGAGGVNGGGDGPVFVAHGMLGSSANWTSLAKRISGASGRRVVAFDARNHGLSEHADTMSYAEMADDLLRVVSSSYGYGLDRPVVLLGHSMGGRTAMYAALRNPDIVERLVVVDVSPVNIDHDPSSSSDWNMAHIFHAMKAVNFMQPEGTQQEGWTVSKARKDADSQLSRRLKDPGLRAWLLMNMAQDPETKRVGWRPNVDAIARAFESDIRYFPSCEGLKPLQKPTLFIGGANSDYLPVDEHPEILEMFPQATFKYVKGAGHWVHSEKPNEFLEIVLEHLA